MPVREIQTQILLLPCFHTEHHHFCSRPCHTDQEKPKVMFTACQLHYLHIPTPCHLSLEQRRISSPAWWLSYILLPTEQERHPGSYPSRAAGQHPVLPWEVAFPFPKSWHTPTVRSKGERCHFAPFILASCQQCQLIEMSNWIYVTGRAALWLEGSIIKPCQACLIFQYRLQ